MKSEDYQPYQGPYLLSDKLDGTSGLLVLPDMKLYTRGNGKKGTDISSIIPYINEIPKYNSKDKLVVRGELLISKKKFKKYEKSYTESRAMVNGLINKKSATQDMLNIIDFVAYEMIFPVCRASDQYSKLSDLKFKTAHIKNIKTLSEKKLSEYLESRKKSGEYVVDGVIVIDDNQHQRNVDGNPKYAFAYKDILEDQIAKTKVLKVEWRVSKDGLLKPRVHVRPTKIGGITVKHITGNNAKFIKESGLGKGAEIEIVRSGDVIPKIEKVIKKVKPEFPNQTYKWNSTNVEIMIDESNATEKSKNDLLVKNITYFLKKSGVKFIDESLVRRLIDAKLNTVAKILSASEEDLMKVEGFQDRMAYKIRNNIVNSLNGIKLSKIMAASNVFGPSLGERKISLITDVHPDIVDKKLTKKQMIDLVKEIDGFSTITSTAFAEGLIEFRKFLKKLPSSVVKIAKGKKKTSTVGGKFQDLKFVFSGFRNNEWKDTIEEGGGKVTETVSKNTIALVVKDKDETTSKITKAKANNVKIMEISEFEKKYMK